MDSETQTTSLPTDRSSETRARILDAALREFSALGMAGARMDQIAAAAGVNKALLYYHFDSKENLYVAALEMIAGRIRDQSMAVFLRESVTGRAAHSLGAESLRPHSVAGRVSEPDAAGDDAPAPGRSRTRCRSLVKRVFAPLQTMYQSMVREGIASGELIDVDWLQIHLATLGANVFYFLAAPVWRILMDFEPFAPEVLEARRRAMVEFLGQAVFIDRAHGAELAARVLADTPMPELPSARHFFGRTDERKK